MPLKTRSSPSIRPSTVPAGAFTIGPVLSLLVDDIDVTRSALYKHTGVRQVATVTETSTRRSKIIRLFLQRYGFHFEAHAPNPGTVKRLQHTTARACKVRTA